MLFRRFLSAVLEIARYQQYTMDGACRTKGGLQLLTIRRPSRPRITVQPASGPNQHSGDARGRNGMNFHRNASLFLLFHSTSNNQTLLFLATRKKGFLAVYCNESHLEANFEFLSLFLRD